MPRRSGKASQRAFLAAFRATTSVTKAAKAAGVDRGAHYEWLANVKGYRALFAAAQDEAAQHLEDEAVRRAQEGVLQAEWYQGKAVGSKRVYSDGLMMFLLRGMRPEKYRQQGALELTGPQGGPIAISLASVLRERKRKREEG